MGLLLQKPSWHSLSDLPPALMPLQPGGTGQRVPPRWRPVLSSPLEPAVLRVSSETLAGRSGRVSRPLSAAMEALKASHLPSAPPAVSPPARAEAERVPGRV